MDNDKGGKLTCFLLGLGLGAGGAMLLAPKMGKEFRDGMAGAALLFAGRLGEEIRGGISEATDKGFKAAHEITNELTHAGHKMSENIAQEAKGAISKNSDRLSKTIEEVSHTLNRGLGLFSEAVKAGRQAYEDEKHRNSKPGGEGYSGRL